MLFNSHIFVFAFMPVVLAAWWLLPISERGRLVLLTAASFVFYGYWDARFILLMALSIAIDFVAAGRIHAAVDHASRRRWLLVSLVANLGLLGLFKYAGFFARSANAVVAALGGADALIVTVPDVVLPVGISFYTFQSMSYSIDIYRGRAVPAKTFWHFAAYVSMFPQLVAGPIVRYTDVQEQLLQLRRRFDWAAARMGIQFFVLGLSKKILIADPIAAGADLLLQQWSGLGLISSWLAMLGYTLQIYFDFSGYSDMAVGLGLLLGFRFPRNFYSPYKAINPSDFWRRWHITLSEWLRDYLYIPLGGNRFGKHRAMRNLVVTMLLGGLWHGAAWTFVVWGAYHGALLALHQVWKAQGVTMPLPLARAATFVAVIVGWVFFRADSMEMSTTLLASMAGLGDTTLTLAGVPSRLLVLLPLGLAVVWFAPNTWQLPIFRSRWAAVAMGVVLAICISRFSEASPFLYFQF